MGCSGQHINLSRSDAEKLLLEAGRDGSYLIRDSESVKAFVLCLLFNSQIHHYRILQSDNGKLSMQAADKEMTKKFDRLEHLIEYYSQPGMGLACELRHPVTSGSHKDDDSDEDEDEDEEEDDVTDGAYSKVVDQLPQVCDSGLHVVRSHLQTVDTGNLDDNFKRSLNQFLREGAMSDFNTVLAGGDQSELRGFLELLSSLSQDLSKEINLFLKRLMWLQKSKLFPRTETIHVRLNTLSRSSVENITDVQFLHDQMLECVAALKTIQIQAFMGMKELVQIHEQQEKEMDKPKNRVFEVFTQGQMTSGFKTKLFLSVSVREETISILKSASEAHDSSNTFKHNKILQVVKSRTNIKRVAVRIEGKTDKEFEFEDAKSREVFCQLFQRLKTVADNKRVDQISVFVGTWNMGDAQPPHNMMSWFQCKGQGKTRDEAFEDIPHDIYAIGTQEASISEKDWVGRIKSDLKNRFSTEFKTVMVCSLWGIRLVVLVKREHEHLISHVEQSCVKTGLGNRLGNKGGVGISFLFGATSLCFVNCHLAARAERVSRRNQNYHDILRGLALGRKSLFDITNQFHHLFWFGDLNYRTQMTLENYNQARETKDYDKLRAADQLLEERRKKTIFFEFEEDEIHFEPTYRYKRGSRKEYVIEKVKRSGNVTNIPSWCDRVLWHSFPETRIVNTSYGCTDDIVTSDHSPVFATFDVDIINQYVPPPEGGHCQQTKEECKIIFKYIKAQIKTNSKTQFYIEFHSSCLEEVKKSGKNNIANWQDKPCNNSNNSTHSCPKWDGKMLPTLQPLFPDRGYLEDQHLQLAVKSSDGDESFGECCIALRTKISPTAQSFRVSLSHFGENTGLLTGEMLVKSSTHSDQNLLQKTYDVVSVEDLDEGNKGSSSKQPKPRERKSVKVPVSRNSEPPQDVANNNQTPPLPSPRKRVPRPTSWQGTSGTLPVQTNLPKQHSYKEKELSNNPASPPPLPVKRKPKTVKEMLKRIGLEQYFTNLQDNGYDELDFLEDLTDENLFDVGILVTDHRAKILEASKMVLQMP